MSLINYDELIAFIENQNIHSGEIDKFRQAYENYIKTGKWQPEYKVITSGTLELEGAMIMTPDNIEDADYQVYLIATNERSLSELLLAFPRKAVGLFSPTGNIIEERVQAIFEGEFILTKYGKYYRGIKRGNKAKAEHRIISKRKDNIAAQFRKLTSLKGKIDNAQYVLEGEMLVERAFSDGLPIEAILYTTNYISTLDRKNFLNQAVNENLSCFQVNDGLMGSITSTRPVPSILASVHLTYPPLLTDTGHLNLHFSKNCSLLIAENVSNPDNLGMTLRTADAAGVSAVLICGEGASPLHKNCIRASRGAVGRIPTFYATDTICSIDELKQAGWNIIGATASAEIELYDMQFPSPTAIVVGNENTGLSEETRQQCTELVRIPMAAGQSSLNVGVAAGILLFELNRQRMINGTTSNQGNLLRRNI